MFEDRSAFGMFFQAMANGRSSLLLFSSLVLLYASGFARASFSAASNWGMAGYMRGNAVTCSRLPLQTCWLQTFRNHWACLGDNNCLYDLCTSMKQLQSRRWLAHILTRGTHSGLVFSTPCTIDCSLRTATMPALAPRPAVVKRWNVVVALQNSRYRKSGINIDRQLWLDNSSTFRERICCNFWICTAPLAWADSCLAFEYSFIVWLQC